MTKLFDPKNHIRRADVQLKSSHSIPQKTNTSPWIILCDFDGTISLEDTTDILLENFGMMGWQTLEQDWLTGRIGSRECMGAQIALLDVDHQTLYQHLAEMSIDPGFKDFVALANTYEVPTQIVSDGLDSAIRFILEREGLGYLPIFANQLIEHGNNRWSLAFPHADDQCIKASGNCKCARAASVKITPQLTSQRILYIGDGSSDFCVSNRVDLVLAKDKLIDYCRAQRIAHYPIQNFNDAIALLPEILSSASFEITSQVISNATAQSS